MNVNGLQSDRFKDRIDLIAGFTDRPVKKLQDYHGRILLTGAGTSLRTLGASLLRKGVKRVFLAPTDVDREDLGLVDAALAGLHEQGINSSYGMLDCNGTLVEAMSQLDVIVYCSDQPVLQEVDRWTRICIRNGLTFMSGVLLGDDTVIGPVVTPGSSGCWPCAIMDFSHGMEHGRSIALWQTLALGRRFNLGDELCSERAAALGNAMAKEVFQLLSFGPSEGSGTSLMVLDDSAVEFSKHRFSSHPLCPVCLDRNLIQS